MIILYYYHCLFWKRCQLIFLNSSKVTLSLKPIKVNCLSYRNHSIDLQLNTVDLFLCNVWLGSVCVSEENSLRELNYNDLVQLKVSNSSNVITTVVLVVRPAYNFIKKEALVQVFFCEFCEILRTYFLTERWLLLHCGILASAIIYIKCENQLN